MEAITVTRGIETLMRFLDREGESPLVLPRKTLFGSMGGQATIAITGFSRGFDWDSGKIFAVTDTPIQAAGDAFEKERMAARGINEQLGWIFVTLNSNIPDVQKLKIIRKTVTSPKKGADFLWGYPNPDLT
jgi:hypothetical protein